MKRIILLFLFMSLAGYHLLFSFGKAPGKVSLKTLLAAPDTVTVDGQQLVLETYLWRDFMPISPPEGKPLRATVTILPVNQPEIQSPFEATEIWVIYDKKIWSSPLEAVGNPPSSPPYPKIEKMASGGPKWGPGVLATVVVRIKNQSGKTFLLKAENQPIVRTD
jgi:hypothetical protein